MSLDCNLIISYKWIIKNFNCVIKQPQRSKPFSLESSTKLEWYLKIDCKKECKKYCECGMACTRSKRVSLELVNIKAIDAPLELKIEFSVLSPSDGPMYSRSIRTSGIVANKSFGFYNFICLTDLQKLTYDKSVTILCRVTELRNSSTEVKSIFESFLDDKTLCDVTLVVDNNSYLAHKVILAANSPVFRKMFYHEMEEAISNVVKIKQMDSLVFEEVLRYIYTRSIKNLKKLAPGLLIAANRYEIDDLKLICERTIINNLELKNVIEYLRLGDDHNSGPIKESCFLFITRNFNAVIQSNDFKGLQNSHPNLLVELYVEIGSKYNVKFEEKSST